MNRLTFLVDGFNLYHAIAGTPRFRPYRWLDLRAVCEQFAGSKDRIEEIFWFTAYYPGKPDKRLRHQIYAAALREKGVTPVLGKFRRKDKYCAGCRQTFPVWRKSRQT